MAGEAVRIDVFEDITIKDVNKDIAQVSAYMAYWGDVQASAQEELTANDAHYRHWRANLTNTIKIREEKIAEWKIKAEIEATKEFLQFKLRQAQFEKNVLLARAMFVSYDKKANLLQSKGANLRSGLDAPDSIPASDYEAEDVDLDDENDDSESSVLAETSVSSDDRLSKMKLGGIFKKGKK